MNDDDTDSHESVAAFGNILLKGLEGIKHYRHVYIEMPTEVKTAMRLVLPALRAHRDEVDKLISAMIRS